MLMLKSLKYPTVLAGSDHRGGCLTYPRPGSLALGARAAAVTPRIRHELTQICLGMSNLIGEI